MREVSDEQATTYVFRRAQTRGRGLVLDQGYSHIDACRSLGVVDSALRRWVKQPRGGAPGCDPEEQGVDA